MPEDEAPSSATAIEVVVNGERRRVEADLATPLLWVLRDHIGLTGTKYGCGIGACGACTVLEGATAVRACQVTLAVAAGRSYTTIEGLSADGSHPLQRAWLAEDVAQCGDRQPGMLLEVVALLRRTPKPTRAEIDGALGDHLCRCGSYPRILRAVALAAQSGGGR